MLKLEQKIHDALPTPARQRRFAWMVDARHHLARLISQLTCWSGSVEHPTLDRQIVLYEEAIIQLVKDRVLAATLMAKWAADDAALIHVRGYAPPGLDCPVCEQDGAYGLSDALASDMLARLPDEML